MHATFYSLLFVFLPKTHIIFYSINGKLSRQMATVWCPFLRRQKHFYRCSVEHLLASKCLKVT